MKRALSTSLMVGLLIAGAACERRSSSSDSPASGPLSDAERGLLGHISKDVNVIFGGNYKSFNDHWEQSPLKDLVETLISQDDMGGEGMLDYMACWLDADLGSNLVAGVRVSSTAVSVDIVLEGLGRDALARCADAGGFAHHVDEDGKYLELRGLPDGAGGTSSVGYYFIDSKTAFTSMELPLGLIAAPIEVERRSLEQRLERAASESAADNAAIREMVAKVDRSKAFWMAGGAAGTPLAAMIDGGHGSFDLTDDGIIFEFSLDLRSAQAASSAVKEFEKLSALAALAPRDLRPLVRSILDNSSMTSSDKTLEGRFELRNDALESALPALRAMMADGLN